MTATTCRSSSMCTASSHAWEKKASVQLRDGDPDAIDAYAEHDRLPAWASLRR